MKKYSIIICCYNGIKYLPTCIKTIVSQNFDDYEIILSDDHSIDGTSEYIDSLKNENIKVFHTEKRLSMAEHWEFALSKATGEWQMFVGQDDGLQLYFFEYAEKVIQFAKDNKCRAITSSRAYYFWPGCEAIYGNLSLSYRARNKITIKNTYKEIKNALFMPGLSYFALPQMYTNSLFSRDLLEDVKRRQGKVFITHPQDANLAAIACSIEKNYVYTGVPLGWIGASPKSAGMAIALNDEKNVDKAIKDLANEYKSKTEKSELKTDIRAGNFLLDSIPCYFYNAMLVESEIQNEQIKTLINSKKTQLKVYSNARLGIKQNKIKYYNDLIIQNNILFYQKIFIRLQIIKIQIKKIFQIIKRITENLFSKRIKITQYCDLYTESVKIKELLK